MSILSSDPIFTNEEAAPKQSMALALCGCTARFGGQFDHAADSPWAARAWA